MRKSQRGVTVLGWIILLTPVAVVGYAGIRLIPLYLNYFRVVKVLEQTASESRDQSGLDVASIRNSIEKRFNVEYVDNPTAKEIDIHREGDDWVAVAKYEEEAPLFGNISLLVDFDKQVALK
jgi:Domain of unknown function (DUF4845)